jgi:RNA polymerase sigma-70 factor (ECF subfamily)
MKDNERQTEDLYLVARIRSGDEASLERLVDKYIPQLIGFFRYLRVPDSMIEDLVQETFERLLRKLDSFDADKKFSAWLMTIGRNLYFDERRKNLRQKDRQAEVTPPHQPTPEEEVVVRQSASELLQTLNQQERFLVDLRIFQGLAFAEIAELTNENETTLRSRFFRLMGRLRLASQKAMSAEN